jgi:hypothetical protein
MSSRLAPAAHGMVLGSVLRSMAKTPPPAARRPPRRPREGVGPEVLEVDDGVAHHPVERGVGSPDDLDVGDGQGGRGGGSTPTPPSHVAAHHVGRSRRQGLHRPPPHRTHAIASTASAGRARRRAGRGATGGTDAHSTTRRAPAKLGTCPSIRPPSSVAPAPPGSAEIVPALVDYIRVPALSPAFDPAWQEHGHLEAVAAEAAAWARGRAIAGPAGRGRAPARQDPGGVVRGAGLRRRSRRRHGAALRPPRQAATHDRVARRPRPLDAGHRRRPPVRAGRRG